MQMFPPPNRKVLVTQLISEAALDTDGTTACSFTDTDCEMLENLGPYIESVRALTVIRNRTANFELGVHFSWSHLGRTFSTPVIIQTALAANGEVISGDYSTSANFCGLKLKALIGVRNATGTARESGQVSAWLVVTLKS